MSYVRAKIAAAEEERSFRIYVTDTLWMQGEHKKFASRWIDIIRPESIDTRTADEIAQDVIKRAGLIVKGGGENECI